MPGVLDMTSVNQIVQFRMPVVKVFEQRICCSNDKKIAYCKPCIPVYNSDILTSAQLIDPCPLIVSQMAIRRQLCGTIFLIIHIYAAADAAQSEWE